MATKLRPRPASESPADRPPAPRRHGLLRQLRGAELRDREARFGLTLVTPTVLLVMAVVVLPFLWTVLLAFQRLRLIDLQNVFDVQLTLRNFRVIFGSARFWGDLWTTLAYTVGGTTLAIAIGLVAALSLRGSFHGRALVRGLVLVPYVMPVVSAALVWRILLNSQFGPVNAFGIEFLGWDHAIVFLSQRTGTLELLGFRLQLPLALLVVIVFEGWRSFPLAFLFLLARLQSVPRDLEEAALVDGATILQRFRHIILPQLSGVIALLALLRFIWTFQNFNNVYLLTGGAGGTEVVAVQIYNYLTARNDVGAASALGLVLSVILIASFLVYYRVGVATQEED